MWQNELAILEFIHLLVETMDRHFGNVFYYFTLWPISSNHGPYESSVPKSLHLDGKFNINLATLFIVPSWRHPSPGCLRGHPSLLAVQALLGSLNP
ncbi:hypothetical protein Gotur_022280 [Gossypium turneri]